MIYKSLLFFLFCSLNILKAQDTIRTLIISEARIDNMHNAYVELTNVGADTLSLAQFEFGVVGPWTIPYMPDDGSWFMLPNKKLAPGKSFVMAKVSDFCTKMWAKFPNKYNRYESKPEFNTLADMQIHIAEAPVQPNPLDSVSVNASVMNIWNGSYCWYIRHHLANGDSVVVDQVGGVFDSPDNRNYNKPYDVAGVIDATGHNVLIRKATIKKGNTDFYNRRGTNAFNSEWIVIPFLSGIWEPDRAVFWTTGNHGDFHLNSLTSSTLTINWIDSILEVPWGIRNDDSVMYKFNRVPGIAWHYDYAKTKADSAYASVRTGDKLTVYACGNEIEKAVFRINVLAPTASDNIVIPKYVPTSQLYYRGASKFCEITDNVPGMDTIRGIPFACEVDTLLQFLEKPAQAIWEIVWVDGTVRSNLKKGDILKVTSENGTIKQYYIKPDRYYPSDNANLSAITWPDIPDYYKGMFGWRGDTIPNFNPSKLYYKILVPWDISGIPALIGKPTSINAKIQTERATNLRGESWERTMKFTCIAEDGTNIKVYTIELVKECCIQPQQWKGEPFISQYVFRQDYYNDFCEIVNPGTSSIDLSDYMITFGYYNSADEAITRVSGVGDWTNRYNKYVPGYKWVDETTWAATPSFLEPDLMINPIVEPHGVFVMADIRSNPSLPTYPDFVIPHIDIDFYHNPWGDSLSGANQSMQQWWGQKIMLFKILNDSIKNGLKPANDPNDFELIDVMGDSAGVKWEIAGKPANQNTSWIRKPEIYKGNPVIQSSFGTTKENSEWDDSDIIEYTYRGYPWPENILMVADGIGNHYMNEVTLFKSTVSSNKYAVSKSYSYNETIRGIVPGTTLNNFYSNIIKADTGQHLKVKKVSDGSILTGSDILSMGDTLIVVSADSTHISKYWLNLTPLSNDAVLTSTLYSITINDTIGTIGNFTYGTDLRTVFEGVTVPEKATIEVIDAKGAYVPMKMLNFEDIYKNVKVNNQIFFEVIAEDRTTKIVYQLQPDFSNSDAFVTSNVYNVDNLNYLIKSIPYGTSVISFYANVVPAKGATIKIIDKYGVERISGKINTADRLLVTAADGVTTRTYYFFTRLCILPFPILSSTVYTVDYFSNVVTCNLGENILVGTFMSNLKYPGFVTIKLCDKLGIEKDSTDYVTNEDSIRLISLCDGRIIIIYSITFTTSNPLVNKDFQINVYPNPGTDYLYISGLQSGNRIRICNLLGEIVLDKNALQTTETIPIYNLPKGVYFMKIGIKGTDEVCKKIIVN